ncbi:hypothetical protein E2P81_ATG06605 [Venturia nashicola]|uniref:Secreted protein n=1 Tax=Venturia nashicola TaxID=86259 RepID=A0A4Z1P075_9PEZI|nr:hypothetical protein E6O75_ATG06774 [Venturia nashicola]TLD29952.1 hypothetical protein E2P81_ATG06605 [Venturia nashicola]
MMSGRWFHMLCIIRLFHFTIDQELSQFRLRPEYTVVVNRQLHHLIVNLIEMGIAHVGVGLGDGALKTSYTYLSTTFFYFVVNMEIQPRSTFPAIIFHFGSSPG